MVLRKFYSNGADARRILIFLKDFSVFRQLSKSHEVAA